MNELSLVIQTVCLEAAVGIMLFLAVSRLWNKNIDGKLAAICSGILAVVGVATSITHLGTPLRAFNSLLNIGSSWMSRETLLVALFTVCAVLCLIINLWKPAMKAVIRVLEWAGAIIGVVLLFSMASIYTFASVPAWEGANTYIEYYTTAIILGAILYYALTSKQQNGAGGKILGVAALAALAVQIVSSEVHTVGLAAGGSAAAAASVEMLSSNSTLIAVKWALMFLGVGVFCLMNTRAASPKRVTVMAGGPQENAGEAVATANPYAAWLAACAVVVAAFIGKVVFFVSMVTMGIGT